MSDIGKYIRKAREEKGISARELSRRSGISQGYISQIETGKHSTPKKSTVIKLADALKISRVEPLRIAGFLDEGVVNAIEVLKIKDWEQASPPATPPGSYVADLHEIITGNEYVEYKGKRISDSEKEKILTLIETILD
ncbi:helix-turn-helix domain-containing protein [Alteribacillus bidgolensis]|uniref:Helix-turn-helix n=1 Tax=Alteribacillus bidgolensis TaxID=930129 RepID=A0A1G8JHW1_9BACI|nr:helix-turn-helix transcriptional regulator [Alteribacillus bidgolensis]SDI30230.1 Helix-turn-helix [Alteribacillus bidgolensis]